MGMFPILVLTAACVAVLLALILEKVAWGVCANKAIRLRHLIPAMVALVVIWGLTCLAITVSAGLSHSERIKNLVPPRCSVLFLILVGLPGLILLVRHWRSNMEKSDIPRMKRLSVLVFCVLISLIFFLSAKSGMWPPLAVTSKYSFSRISQLLIRTGVNINEEDAYGFAPIWYAAQNGDLTTAELLLEKGADLHKWGGVSLGQACVHGHRDVAEALINHGVDINAIVYDYPQWNVLMAAANAGQLDVITMLVRKGASLDLRDKGGKTALMIAEGRKQIQIAEFLKGENTKRKKNE
jgi:hypothetical protein